MITSLLKYLTVFVFGMFKFLFAPATGIALGESFTATALLSISGMMTSVILFSFFGDRIRRFNARIQFGNPNNKRFSKRKRIVVRIWRKYGLLVSQF